MMIEHIKNALWIDSIGLNPYSNGMMIEPFSKGSYTEEAES